VRFLNLNEVPWFGFRNPLALYEGPNGVLRYALRAPSDNATADEAECLYHEAVEARYRQTLTTSDWTAMRKQKAGIIREDDGLQN
jgi:hypothetical protein